MNTVSEAQVQREVDASPKAQSLFRRLAVQRLFSALFFISGLVLFLSWLPSTSRHLFILSLLANRLLIGLLLLFGLLALSLLWSFGQKLDVWLFKLLNLRGYRARWLDWVMWIATQIGNFIFATVIVIITYILGDRHFAIGLTLGALSLLLLVTLIKASTDRARPFNLMVETRVIGWREAGLSFPSGHTAQTFFLMTLASGHFHLSFGTAFILYTVAVLVGFTRVYLGVHYPRDVMAGGTLGIIWGILGVLVAPYLFG